ncbi:MAG: ATP-binding protein [Acidobacteriaceae bacterium]|jgi:signal transduction histidine kinase
MEPSAQPSPTATPVPPATLPRLPLPRLGNTPTLREQGGDALALAGIAHDARNLVTALGLCAEMIGEPGVLAPHHGHFATEIRSITTASASLVERISGLARTAAQANPGQGTAVRAKETPVPETPVTDLSEAVRQMGSLLSAVAGPVTELQIACLPCRGQLRLSEESLSRILVNLVRNAADARPTGGRIRITTQRGGGESFLWTLEGETPGEQSAQYLWDDSPHPSAALPHTVLLTVEDDGPGIPTEFLERVFETGFTTRQGGRSWPEPQHHGLGLSIVRQLVDAAGGTVRAVVPPSGGGRFEIELPLTNVTPNLLSVLPVHGENEGQ